MLDLAWGDVGINTFISASSINSPMYAFNKWLDPNVYYSARILRCTKIRAPPPIPLWRDKQPSLSNSDYRERGDIDFRCTVFLFLRYISQSTENNKDQMLLTQHLAFTVSGAQQTIGTHVAVDDVNIRRHIMQMTN